MVLGWWEIAISSLSVWDLPSSEAAWRELQNGATVSLPVKNSLLILTGCIGVVVTSNLCLRSRGNSVARSRSHRGET